MLKRWSDTTSYLGHICHKYSSHPLPKSPVHLAKTNMKTSPSGSRQPFTSANVPDLPGAKNKRNGPQGSIYYCHKYHKHTTDNYGLSIIYRREPHDNRYQMQFRYPHHFLKDLIFFFNILCFPVLYALDQ